MKITTIEEGKRVLCEHSYYRWYQQNSPVTFADVITQINIECGMDDIPTVPKTYPYTYNATVHSIEVKIEVAQIEPLVLEVKTSLHLKRVYLSRIAQLNESDMFLPYLSEYISDLREVWEEQKEFERKWGEG